MDVLTTSDLRNLASIQAEHCITIYMPTNVTGRDAEQDPARLRDLLQQAEDNLVKRGMRAPEARTFLEPARSLITDAFFWRERSQGVAIFICPESLMRFRLPLDFTESVIVNRRFHIKPLLALLAGDNRFYLLALSQNKVRLLDGTRHGMRELEVKGMPVNIQEALNYDEADRGAQVHSAMAGTTGKQAAVFHGQGGQKDTAKTDITQFFRMVDESLHDVLTEGNVPLMLAGVDYLLPIYRAVCSYPHTIDTTLSGNCDHLSAHQLHERAWPLVQPNFEKTRDEVLAKYRELGGSGKTTNDVEKIVTAAYQGQVDTLLLDLNADEWGVFDAETNTTEVHIEAEAGDEDLLDLAAVQTLLHRGTIQAVDRDQMPNEALIAAMLRY